MARKDASYPRKRPLQERSRATVDAIVEAAARILAREGFDATSVNDVAELAGVSIGSLYQYFPGKGALAAAVAEREAGRLLETLGARFAAAAGGSLEEMISALVAGLIENHSRDPALHRVLREEVPQGRECEHVGDELAAAEQAALAWLEARDEGRARPNLELAVFVAVRAVEAVVHTAVVKQPERLRDPAFAGELTALVMGYLGAAAR
jgi:AcrR family transcriptional regulator